MGGWPAAAAAAFCDSGLRGGSAAVGGPAARKGRKAPDAAVARKPGGRTAPKLPPLTTAAAGTACAPARPDGCRPHPQVPAHPGRRRGGGGGGAGGGWPPPGRTSGAWGEERRGRGGAGPGCLHPPCCSLLTRTCAFHLSGCLRGGACPFPPPKTLLASSQPLQGCKAAFAPTAAAAPALCLSTSRTPTPPPPAARRQPAPA